MSVSLLRLESPRQSNCHGVQPQLGFDFLPSPYEAVCIPPAVSFEVDYRDGNAELAFGRR